MNWQDEIGAARARIAGHARVTPVTRLTLGGFDVEVKLEQMQHTGSFKARGAFNTLLSAEVPAAGVVAASGGNHGAAVAYAAASLGLPAHVFVPEVAGPSKIALIERAGATCHVVPGLYADALEAALAHEAATGAMQVHAYDSAATVAGQGTCLAEWEAQGLEADTVLVAVGGGGLIAGSLAWLGGRRRVVAVEPDTSRCAGRGAGGGRPGRRGGLGRGGQRAGRAADRRHLLRSRARDDERDGAGRGHRRGAADALAGSAPPDGAGGRLRARGAHLGGLRARAGRAGGGAALRREPRAGPAIAG